MPNKFEKEGLISEKAKHCIPPELTEKQKIMKTHALTFTYTVKYRKYILNILDVFTNKCA